MRRRRDMKFPLAAIVFIFHLVFVHSSLNASEPPSLQQTIQKKSQSGKKALRSYIRSNKDKFDSRFVTAMAEQALADRDEKTLLLAITVAEDTGDLTARANCYEAAGRYYYFVADNDRAWQFFDKALAIYNKSGDENGRGKTYSGMAEVLFRRGRNSEALAHHDTALAIFVKTGNIGGQSLVYLKQGRIMYFMDEYSRALELFDKAIPLLEKANDISGLGEAYLNKGILFFYQGKIDEAATFLDRALSFYKKCGDKFGEGRVYEHRAKVLQGTGRIEEAMKSYETALSLFKAVNYPIGQANIHVIHGEIYLVTGDTDKSIEMFKRALSLYEKGNSKLGLANAHWCLLHAYYMKGDYGLALESYRKAADLYTEVSSSMGLGDVYWPAGNIYRLRKETAKSRELYEKALDAYAKADYVSGRGQVYLSMGDLYADTGDEEQALQFYERAHDLFEKSLNIDSRAYALLRKAPLIAKKGRTEEAASLYDQAMSLLEKVRRQTGLPEMKKTYLEKVYGDYENAAIFMIQNRFREKAFRYAESMNARVFLDQLAEGLVDLEKGIDPDLKKRRDGIEQEMSLIVNRIQKTGKDQADSGAAIRNLQKRHRELENSLGEVRRLIRLKNPLYSSVQYPEPITVGELQSSVLRQDEIVLEYFLSKSGVYCFVIGKDTYEIVRLDTSVNELERDIHLLTGGMNSASEVQRQIARKSRFPRAQAVKLYETLLKPVEKYAGGKTVIIVPHGALSLLPFETLMIKTDEGFSFVMDSYSIKYVQSASVLGILRSRYKKDGAGSRFIGFGDPVYDYENYKAKKPEMGSETRDIRRKGTAESPSRSLFADADWRFDRLVGSGEEVREIQSIFLKNGHNAKIMLRLDAKENFAKTKDMIEYGYIHFSSHGILNDRYQAIVLSRIPGDSEDGYLTLGEIMNSRYNAHLVVLSACQTGLGRIERGEGVTGLTRAVMYAGSSAAVVSLWSVSDEGTKELMIRFYEGMITKGMTGEEALRAAKRGMLADRSFHHPYFWSAFIMYGE